MSRRASGQAQDSDIRLLLPRGQPARDRAQTAQARRSDRRRPAGRAGTEARMMSPATPPCSPSVDSEPTCSPTERRFVCGAAALRDIGPAGELGVLLALRSAERACARTSTMPIWALARTIAWSAMLAWTTPRLPWLSRRARPAARAAHWTTLVGKRLPFSAWMMKQRRSSPKRAQKKLAPAWEGRGGRITRLH